MNLRHVKEGLLHDNGQVGALVAGVVFGLVSDRAKFYISAWCGALGALLTLFLVPDISALDLSEGEFHLSIDPVNTVVTSRRIFSAAHAVPGARHLRPRPVRGRLRLHKHDFGPDTRCISGGLSSCPCCCWCLTPEGKSSCAT